MFAVPLFDEFTRRIMPRDDWKEGQLEIETPVVIPHDEADGRLASA